jgi:hemerythrin-like domain-containing protein
VDNFSRLLREEHEVLLAQIERIRSAADAVGQMPEHALHRNLEKICEFLTDHLMPHARAEEEVFYPAVARVLGTPQATVTMSRDHAELSRLTDEFRSLRTQTSGSSEQNANDLRRVLYGLYAVLKLHLAKEEEIFTPLLDQHLNDEEAHRLFHKMTEATHGNALHDRLNLH